MFSQAVLAAFAHDSAAIRTVEVEPAEWTCTGGSYVNPFYWLWIGRREQAVQVYLLGLRCGLSALSLGLTLRNPVLAPLADDPRIQALRAASDSILARARWR